MKPDYHEQIQTQEEDSTRKWNQEFCGDCQYLSITEKDQNIYRFSKPPHICRKHDVQLYHYGHHPEIPKCDECATSTPDRETNSEVRKENMWKRIPCLDTTKEHLPWSKSFKTDKEG